MYKRFEIFMNSITQFLDTKIMLKLIKYYRKQSCTKLFFKKSWDDKRRFTGKKFNIG